ncbi:MAG: hypothetical protein LBI72_04635 [Flavobacteriaceae bacterium]|jgi:hypothetical protein|nr:hypothetical protein [Flavobacteriaceae bacterium]
MMRKICVLFVLFLVNCNTYIRTDNTKDSTVILDLERYNGPYYITITLFPKGSHRVIMGGVGEKFDLLLLDKGNLNSLVESFYYQMFYLPLFFDDVDYKNYAKCLGYDIVWYTKYSKEPIYSNVIEENRIILNDGTHVILKKYKIFGELDVKYVSDFKDCVYSNSLELDINQIKTITKVAVFLDK